MSLLIVSSNVTKGRDYVLCCTIELAQGLTNTLGLYRIYTYRMNNKINTVMLLGAASMLSRNLLMCDTNLSF